MEEVASFSNRYDSGFVLLDMVVSQKDCYDWHKDCNNTAVQLVVSVVKLPLLRVLLCFVFCCCSAQYSYV